MTYTRKTPIFTLAAMIELAVEAPTLEEAERLGRNVLNVLPLSFPYQIKEVAIVSLKGEIPLTKIGRTKP
jgi:hypothetical protein